jgi:hypothetical protein
VSNLRHTRICLRNEIYSKANNERKLQWLSVGNIYIFTLCSRIFQLNRAMPSSQFDTFLMRIDFQISKTALWSSLYETNETVLNFRVNSVRLFITAFPQMKIYYQLSETRLRRLGLPLQRHLKFGDFPRTLIYSRESLLTHTHIGLDCKKYMDINY